MKYNLFLAIAMASLVHIAPTQAAEIVGEVTAVVNKATCTLVAKEDATGSTILGTGAGAVGGAVLGRLVGGKKGTGWGAALGAVGGGLVGNNMADETYACKAVVMADGKSQLIETTSEKKLKQGDTITLIKTDDGKLSVM
ncbi:Glycine zipper 2TM domain protein [compost metagenome]